MKILTKKEEKCGLLTWRTEDGKFAGVIMEPFVLEEAGKPETREEMPAAALLAVPKHSRHEPISINDYSPLIVQAASSYLVTVELEKWADEHAGKRPWDLRRD